MKAAQTQDECDKKEKENIKKSEEFRHEYTNACKNLGIDGSSTKTSEIKNFCKESDIKICFDTSHAKLAANALNENFRAYATNGHRHLP